MKSRLWLAIVAVFLVLAVGAVFTLTALKPYEYHGAYLDSPKPAPDFTLTTQDGQSASLSDFRGHLVFLYFGYTFCPDVCPTTLVEVMHTLELLGPAGEDIQVIMVTVDPERDTPAALAAYLGRFGYHFLGMTGSLEDISSIASLYGIYFARRAGTTEQTYLVDHTAALMLIDQAGYLKLVFPYGTPAADIAADVEYLTR